MTLIGQVIGNYRVEAELGKGGMGVVYRATHVQLGRPAALKMLLPQLSTDPAIVQRFFNEARAASAIDHPGIVEIYDFGRHTDGRAYIVMALLKGESLEHRLLHGPLAPVEGATIVAQVAGALAAAHARGIVHRDLKPDNIFLVPNELMPGGVQVKLLDFGIAKLADDQVAGVKTQTGALIGTPAYMSPEQCMGRADLDHRTDLYSLGCILFHVLCGRPPFISDQGTGVMIAAHLRDPAPHPRTINPTIPEALAAIILRLLEKDPAARFQSATELRDALARAGAAVPATRPGADPALGYGATVSLPPAGAAVSAVAGPVAGAVSAYGATAHSAAPMPTTHSGASGQIATTVPGAPGRVSGRHDSVPAPAGARRGRRGLWLGVAGVLAAGAAIAAVVVTTRGGESSGSRTAASGSATAASGSATPVAAGNGSAVVAAGSGSAAASPPPVECPLGQVRTPDTQGHCCWTDQAWSSAKSACVGTPHCPSSMTAKGDQCAETLHLATDHPGKPIKTVDAPDYQLGGTVFAPGTEITVTFAQPVSSPPDHRSWITIAEARQPPTSYGDWTYVEHGARTAKLRAPTKPGSYELRLHTDYPKKTTNLRRSVAFDVDGTAPSTVTPLAQQRFSVASTQLHAGDKINITFPAPMHATPGEQFWITVVPAGTADATWGPYEYVTEGARALTLAAPDKPGDYEIRLHANYPTKTTNVVHRVELHVD